MGVLTPAAWAAATTVTPGTVWTDTSGATIQAHGEGITKVGDTYYWLGEDKTGGSPFQSIDNSRYSERKAGVATSGSACGSYTYRGSFKPLGHDSLFLDGSTAYFLSEDRANTKLQIYQLSADFLSVTALVKTLNQYEASAMAKQKQQQQRHRHRRAVGPLPRRDRRGHRQRHQGRAVDLQRRC